MRYLLTLSLIAAILVLNLVPTGTSQFAFGDEDDEWEEFYDGPSYYNWFGKMELEDVSEMSRTGRVSALLSAAERDDISTLTLLMEFGMPLNSRDQNGNTALHIAAEKGAGKALAYLLKKGADSTALNMFRSTPLHSAAQKGNASAVAVLLRSGADPNARDAYSLTPPLVALTYEQKMALSAFIRAGVDVGAQLSEFVSQGRPLAHMRVIAVHPLLAAACCDRPELLQILKDKGADVAESDGAGRGALHYAAKGNAALAVRFLVEAGANPNSRDNKGLTPLHVAAENNSIGAITTLLASGADPSARAEDQKTPLLSAVYAERAEAIIALVGSGVPVDARDALGWTSLHHAAQAEKKNALGCLLRLGADPNARAEDGRTPLLVLGDKGHLNFSTHTQYFRKGETARVVRAELKAAKVLLEAGADDTICGPDGLPPALKVMINKMPLCAACMLKPGTTVLDLVQQYLESRKQEKPDRMALNAFLAGACALSDPETVKLLCRSGAFANHVAGYEWNARPVLNIAAETGHAETVAALLAAGAKPTFYDKNMRTALHEAAEVGSLTATKLLIEAGANVDARNNDRETPLHIACKGGWSKLIELFVSCKADVTALDERLNTPLHLLLSSDTYHDELELVKASIELLLKSGADINAQNRKKLTPLLTLLQKDHYFGAERPEKLVEFMIGKGAKLDSIDGGPSILHSLKWDSPEIAKVCIAAGTPVDGADDSGRTPLHMAAAHGLFEVAGVLVSSGANINARDHDGLTPLHQVLIHTQSRSPIKIFKFLLDSGADIEAVANDGSSVMAIAIRSNIHTAVRLLLDRGAKIADADESGLTPLHLAASLGSIDAAEVLLKAGADPDAVDKQQMTPVLYALAFGDKDLLKLLDPDGTRCRSGLEKLIQNGGELNTTAEGGKQMIHGAAELNQTWAISALLEAGVSPDEQCEGRTTAIGYAAMTDSVEAAKLLISANADLERADEAAALPTAIALKHWSFEVLRLLVQAGASKPDMKRFWGGPGYSGIGSLPPDIQELLKP